MFVRISLSPIFYNWFLRLFGFQGLSLLTIFLIDSWLSLIRYFGFGFSLGLRIRCLCSFLFHLLALVVLLGCSSEVKSWHTVHLHELLCKVHSMVDEAGQSTHRLPSPIDLQWVIMIMHDYEYFKRGLAWMLNFKERMRVVNCLLTILAKIKIMTDRTPVSCPSNVMLLASVTSVSFVNNWFR